MKKLLSISLASLAILSACGSTQKAVSPVSPSASSSTTVSTIVNPAPSDNSNQPKPIAPGISVSSESFSSYKIFLVALEDKGKSGKAIGCDDSVVAVEGKAADTVLVRTDDRIKEALTELFSLKSATYGESGLDNALAASDLKVDSIYLDQSGKATVKLSGQLSLGGVCDSPRVEAQIEQTVRQFPEVKDATISLNGQTLQSQLSEKGE